MTDQSNSRRSSSHRSSRERRPFSLAGSGMVTAGILVIGLLIFGAYWQAHRRAAFHKLRTRNEAPAPATPMPGGQEPVTLQRLPLQDDATLEFVSATLLPGVGMQFLQATFSVPGRGQFPLLQGPSLADAAALAPASMQTSPIHLYVSSTPFSTKTQATTSDLIGSGPASGVETETLPDGGQVTARFPASPAASPDVVATVTGVLNGRTLDLIVAATNNASADRYLAFEWTPRFSALIQQSNLVLTLPSRQLWKNSAQSAAPPDMDFAMPGGRKLEAKPLDLMLVDLHTEILADGPAVRLMNVQNGTLLRITASNPNIRSLQVQADPASQTLALGFKSIDPTPDGNHSGDLLHPGQTAQWRVHIDILPNTATSRQASQPSLE